MEKITLTKVKDDSIGAALLVGGLTLGSMAMKFANTKVSNPWITPAIAVALGFGVRLMTTNENAKDIGSGVMAAGVADGLKKGLNMLAAKVPALQAVSDSIPTLSGMGRMGEFPIIASQLRGDYAPAEVVSTAALLRR